MPVAAADNALTTVADVKFVLGIAQTDTTKDDRLQSLINLISGRIEAWCGRQFTEQTYSEEAYDGDPECELILKQYPITEVAAVTVDGVSLASEISDETRFQVYEEEGYLWRAAGWYARRKGIKVTYTAGYATIPAALASACIEWVIILYEGRFKDAKVKGEDMQTAMPDQILSALLPWRRSDG